MYSEKIEKELSRLGVKTGDKIRAASGNAVEEGILMPRPEIGDNGILVIKRKDGYNIGIRFEGTKVEKIEENGKKATPAKRMHKEKLPSHLPKVKILYTGGTIGSKTDYLTGGVNVLVSSSELIGEIPELADIADIDFTEVMRIFSEDMTYKEWKVIAEKIADSFNGGASGVIITIGTDTMHYASAAISFMLQNLNGPVIFTGAQRSPDRGSSDAFMNLICSARIASESDIAEVGICMHQSSSDDACSFIRGTKARKMHTTKRDVFKPINNSPIASVSHDGRISYLGDYAKRGEESKKVVALTGYEPKVALIKITPNSDPTILDFYTEKGYKGIILEGTGMGHTAVLTQHKEYSWLDSIKKAIAKGMIIGMTSQCIYGRTNPKVYATARILSNAGVVYCNDMLPEVAFVKLGFLLGNYKHEEARELLDKNLRGEITERSEYDWFE